MVAGQPSMVIYRFPLSGYRDRLMNQRVDSSGRAYKGSQKWIQAYVNFYQKDINGAVLEQELSLNGSSISWVSPLEKDQFAEYKDRDFLEALGIANFDNDLRAFWPRSGPRWDALAKVTHPSGNRGVLLVEAKSHIQECRSGGCAAGPTSRRQIEESLGRTQRWLGVSGSVDWTGSLYQYANRLAHLYFFREVLKIPAWLLNIYFVNDPGFPTSEESWRNEVPLIKQELGLPGDSQDFIIEAFLDIDELSLSDS